MATIVQNATLIDVIKGDVVTQHGHSFVFEDGKITEQGPSAAYQKRIDFGQFDEIIDAKRHIVIPGLVNTHHHLYQSLTRCLPDAQCCHLFKWLTTLYTHWRHLDEESLRMAAKVSICELLLHGCTTTSDHHYMLPPQTNATIDAVLEAADELGIRIHLCRGSMTLGQSKGGLPPDDIVERDADVLADYGRVVDTYHDPNAYAMRRIDVAPCSPFNVTQQLMRDTRDFATERNVLLHTHLAETLEEEAFCLETFGCRPVEYLAEMNWLTPNTYLAHCVYLNDAEIKLLSETGTGVAHCPASNMRLGSGIARLEDLLAAGIRVGVAVDGSSSNDGGNLLSEAKQALLAARVRRVVSHETTPVERNQPQFSPQAAFKLATVGGASVLNRSELGHLNIGAAADFVMIRTDDIAIAGATAQDPVAALVLCDPPRAERVYVAGKPVVLGGRIAAIDEQKLAAEFNALVAERFV